MIEKPFIGQKVVIGHSAVSPAESTAIITAVHSPTKVTVKNDVGEGPANWFRADQIDNTILPYGQTWCYPEDDKNIVAVRLHVAGPTCCVVFKDGGVTTDGWKEEVNEEDFKGFTEDEQEHFAALLTNARVDAVESVLLALYKAGIIDKHDKRLQDALTEVYDALDNHS